MSGVDLHRSVTELGDALRSHRLCPVDLLEATLERIAATAGLGTYLVVDARGARRAAEAARSRLDAGAARSPIDGVPVALKDNLVTKGLRTTCGSRLMAPWIPPYDGAAAEALKRAGAVIAGKTNLDELGMGSSGEYSAFFPTKNPWDPSRVPGGSSSGSAVAVATGAAGAALGTDTGGSVRLPAAFCGVWGLMPSHGRVSRHGVVAHASSLDRVGVLGRSARDVATLLELLAGPDPRDASCSVRPAGSHAALGAAWPGLRTIGRMRPSAGESVDDTVADALDHVGRTLERLGHRLVDVDPPDLELALDAYYVIASAEAASNLARFDGMRFGHRVEAGGYAESVRASRAAGLGTEVKRRIALGEWVSSTEQYGRVYEQAQRARTAVTRDFARRFEVVDVLLSPAVATAPFRLGARIGDPEAMHATDRWTIPSSLAGLCGLTVPVKSSAGPRAALLTGPAFREAEILALGHSLESEDDRVGTVAWTSRFD